MPWLESLVTVTSAVLVSSRVYRSRVERSLVVLTVTSPLTSTGTAAWLAAQAASPSNSWTTTRASRERQRGLLMDRIPSSVADTLPFGERVFLKENCLTGRQPMLGPVPVSCSCRLTDGTKHAPIIPAPNRVGA